MRGLRAGEVDRLVRSNRQLVVAHVVAGGALFGLMVPLAFYDVQLIGIVSWLFLPVSLLLSVPHRRLGRELGLTPADARAVVLAEKEWRTGVAALPPAFRAHRHSVRATIWLVVTLVLLDVLVVAAAYFFSGAGRIEKGVPVDPWLRVSLSLAIGSLVGGAITLSTSIAHRRRAAAWRQRAGIDPNRA
jgi:hypothetical protein